MSQSVVLEIGHLQLVADVIVWPQVLLAAQLLEGLHRSLGAPVLGSVVGTALLQECTEAALSVTLPVSCHLLWARNRLASFYLRPGELRVVIKQILF